MMSQNQSVIMLAGLVLAGAFAFRAAADPVARDSACRVATSQLPSFFSGTWRLADEFTLEDLAGTTVAYTFIFARTVKQGVGAEATAVAPTSFVARARGSLKAAGKPVNGNTPALYGEDHYASIVISADDTEPPVLRCFLGLPAQVVKEQDALELVEKRQGAGSWRIGRRLMLGMFDEVFVLQNGADTDAAQVVDTRSGAVVPMADAQARAKARKAAQKTDDDRARLCRDAWREAVSKSGTGAAADNAPVRSDAP